MERLRTALLLLVAVLTVQMVGARDAPAQQLAGVHAHLLWPGVDGPNRRAQLQRLKDAGADIVRVDVGWSTLEPRVKGEYEAWYLERLDQLVDEAQDARIALLFDVVDAPCWASSAPAELKDDCRGAWWDRGVQRYAPTDTSDYADALEFLIRRFGSRVRAWEVGNEPNLEQYFRANDPPAAYAALLKAAYARAKAVDPATFVVGGAISTSDVPFVRELLAHGIAGSFDAFSLHPYSENSSPLEPFPDEWVASSFIRGVPQVRDALVDGGVTVPLWLTEFGWSTCATRGSSQWWENCNDEAEQARFIEAAYTQMARWSFVQAGFVYKSVDDGPEGSPTGSDRETQFGMFSYDGRAKPSVAAFQRSAAMLHATGPSDPSPPESPDPGAGAPPPAPDVPAPPVSGTAVSPEPVVAPPAEDDRLRSLGGRSPSLAALLLSGNATRCRSQCVRYPSTVKLRAVRTARVTLSVQARECLQTCRWRPLASTVVHATKGTQRWSLAVVVAGKRLSPGRWRLQSTTREGGEIATREVPFAVVASSRSGATATRSGRR